MSLVRLILVCCIMLRAGFADAHEVWIEPLNWAMPEDATMQAHLRNGQEFKGIDLSWNDKSVVRVELWQGSNQREIIGRLGDIPALRVDDAQTGLAALLYQSVPSTLVYDDFEKFEGFVTEKGQPEILTRHAERQLSQTQVRETYTRFAKALVAFGSGEGQDQARGFEVELVALHNPYAASQTDTMSLALIYQGAPLRGHRVTVFERLPDKSVREILLVSDQQGQVSFPLIPDATYLADAVVLREPSRETVIETRGAMWESLWASLTFQAPKPQ